MHLFCIKMNENPSSSNFFCCKQEIHTEKHFKVLPTHSYKTKRLHRNNYISSHYFPNTRRHKLCTKEFTSSQRTQVWKGTLVEQDTQVCRRWMGHRIQQVAVVLSLLALLSVLRWSVCTITFTLLFQCMFSLHNICPHHLLPTTTRAKHFPIMLCFGKDCSLHKFPYLPLHKKSGVFNTTFKGDVLLPGWSGLSVGGGSRNE